MNPMCKRLYLLPLLFVIAGCSDPKPVPPTAKDETKTEKKTSSLPTTTEGTYKGRGVASWGRDLLDANRVTSYDAAFALSHLGEESLQFFLKGMNSSVAHVRANSVAMVRVEAMKKHADVFSEVLAKLLTDPDPEVRMGAASNICGLKLPGYKGMIEKASERETDKQAKGRFSDLLDWAKKQE